MNLLAKEIELESSISYTYILQIDMSFSHMKPSIIHHVETDLRRGCHG